MFNQLLSESSSIHIIAVMTLFVTAYTIYNLKLHPLSAIPGPFLAKTTPFYPLYLYFRGDFALHMRHLHKIYGDFVRITPKHVATSSSTSMKQLWTTKGFEKGDFYDAFTLGFSKHRDLFTIRTNSLHSQRKRIHANIWSMTSVLEMEPYIDRIVNLFLSKMGKVADNNELMDVSLWTWRYTFDIIGELFFGKAYGFLDQEQDIDNLMAASAAVAPFEGMMGMAPTWLKPFMVWMLVIPNIARGVMYFRKVKAVGKQIVADRMKAIDNGVETRNDMLGKMLRIVQEKGKTHDWSIQDVEQECFVAMVAGNDTVSITLTAIFYHLAAHPSSLYRLQREIDEATASGALSPTIRYKEAATLPYLIATINEGFRIHPMFGYPVPRVVPKGGAEICGRWWPGGTVLGTSCGVPERDNSVFGDDVDSWRPERWLAADRERVARMWDDVCAFGIGQRACIGQHIARCEIMKIIPQFLREFHIETESEWKSLERWFNKPQNILIKVRRRK